MKEQESKEQAINGISNTQLNETIPNYNFAPCENVIEGKNNTSIVLGRDRPSTVLSGYGGMGVDRSGAIDLVAGRTSAIIRETHDGEKIFTDPSIPFDAARITITQRTDVDDNHYLPNGKNGNRKNRSAIIVKADNIRIVAREGIKLVCNIDRFDSNGELKIQKFGVDLLSTDGAKVQPIPKGDNLAEAIKDIYERIATISSTTAVLSSAFLTLLNALLIHTHPSAMGPTGPSIDLSIPAGQIASQLGMQTAEIQQLQILLQQSKLKFLNPTSQKFINSLFHNLD